MICQGSFFSFFFFFWLGGGGGGKEGELVGWLVGWVFVFVFIVVVVLGGGGVVFSLFACLFACMVSWLVKQPRITDLSSARKEKTQLVPCTRFAAHPAVTSAHNDRLVGPVVRR